MPAEEQQCDEDMAEAAAGGSGGEEPPSLEDLEVATALAVGATELSPNNNPHAHTEGESPCTWDVYCRGPQEQHVVGGYLPC
jgi:hypothetical protein